MGLLWFHLNKYIYCGEDQGSSDNTEVRNLKISDIVITTGDGYL